jgi:hypothetical protein
MVHVAETRMIEQGMDDLSRGSFLKGVAIGRDMLSFIDLALSATCHKASPSHSGFCQLVAGDHLLQGGPHPVGETVVCRGARNHRWKEGPPWSVDALACRRWQVLHLGTTSSHS